MKTNYIEQKLTVTNGPARRCRVPLVLWLADQYAVAISQPQDGPAPAARADAAQDNQLSEAAMTACLWPGKPMPADCRTHAEANLASGD